jgi:hypothetical protein
MLLTGQILILLTLEATAKEVCSHFLHLDHTGETINYGWNHGLKSSFKFTVMFGITINFTDKMIQEGDNQLFLLWSLQLVKLRGRHHQLRHNWWDVFLLETVTEVLPFDVFNHSDDTFSINFASKLFQDRFHFIMLT